jgi:hypothetical protein
MGREMNMHEVGTWIEDHKTESIVIGAGGVIVLLWLLGYFSSSSSGDSGASNLASAYYAAEAQQAVVGGQIQMATVNDAAQTAQVGLQANAAVAINAAQTGAAVTINGQNTSTAATINQSNNDALTAQTGIVSNNQLQATYSNNAYAYATAVSNNNTAIATNTANNNTSLLSTYINSVMAPELAYQAKAGVISPDAGGVIPGIGAISVSQTAGSPGQLKAVGFSTSQIRDIWGGNYPT